MIRAVRLLVPQNDTEGVLPGGCSRVSFQNVHFAAESEFERERLHNTDKKAVKCTDSTQVHTVQKVAKKRAGVLAGKFKVSRHCLAGVKFAADIVGALLRSSGRGQHLHYAVEDFAGGFAGERQRCDLFRCHPIAQNSNIPANKLERLAGPRGGGDGSVRNTKIVLVFNRHQFDFLFNLEYFCP